MWLEAMGAGLKATLRYLALLFEHGTFPIGRFASSCLPGAAGNAK